MNILAFDSERLKAKTQNLIDSSSSAAHALSVRVNTGLTF